MLIQIQEPGGISDGVVEYAIGVDLGTSYSVVAIEDGDDVGVIEGNRGALLPSSFLVQDDEIEVGSVDPNALRSIKRLMGRSCDEAKQFQSLYPYPLTEKDGLPAFKLPNGDIKHVVELSSLLLEELRHRAEKCLNHDINKAVITVPAYFDDAARKATRDAAKLAGLDVLRLVNEPTAAALAYGLDSGNEGHYAIYDLGGGTFDVSILRLEKGLFRVLATGGDTLLGGDDVDEAIAEFWGGDVSSSLLHKAREAKQALSEAEEWSDGELLLTRDELYKAAKPIIEDSLDIFQEVLKESGLDKSQIDEVILVGGSTRLQIVRDSIATFIGKKPLCDVDPDLVVSYGAAHQANALTKGSDTILLDVTPLSLGLETMGGIVEVLISRNSPIPVSVKQKFTTFQDNQTGMQLHVVQGEREMVDQCRSLAKFELAGIPPMVAGMAEIEVSFEIDNDGLLTVSAIESTTGAQQSIEVKPSYGLDSDAIEIMLKSSMANAKDDIQRRLLEESKIDAKRLIYSTKQSLEKDGDLLSEAEKDNIINAMENLSESLNQDNREIIDELNTILDHKAGKFAELRVNSALTKLMQGQLVDSIDRKIGE